MKVEELKPEEKVNLSIDMVNVVTSICAEGIRAQNKNVGEEELLRKLRERLHFSKRLGRV